jgi:hypothetical protein
MANDFDFNWQDPYDAYGNVNMPGRGLGTQWGSTNPTGYMTSAGVPTVAGVQNPFTKALGSIGTEASNWFKETPWMGQNGIFSTGLGLLQGIQGMKMNKEMLKGMKTQRSAIETQSKLLKAQAGEVANRQGRLRTVNAGGSANDAYAAGDKFEAEKMAKWGV